MKTSKSITYSQWINGCRTVADCATFIERRSPANGQLVAEYVAGTKADVDAAVAAAKRALRAGDWSGLPASARAAVIARTARLIRQHAESLARVETLESGKPIKQARDEMEWAASIWDYAAALARQLHGEAYNSLGADYLGFTLREPVGVVGLITPWNFPLLIVSQKLPFALAAGCTCVVKPSELTSGTTLRLAELLQEAGLPDGVCNVVTGYGDPVGLRLTEHPDIAMISFTGSTGVGRRIVAGSASTLKKVSLELGGKNPQLIFPDADLDAAVEAVVFGAYFNMGECCNSGSRVLVHESIADDFGRRVAEKAARLKVGDPLDEATEVGAVISEAHRTKICDCIEAGKAAGATVRLDGGRLDLEGGCYVTPVLFDHVTADMAIAGEEIFGPVLSLLRFSSEEEAVEIANSVAYGLSASVWTCDLDRSLSLSRRIEAGTVWVNCFMDGFQELPFGGYKQSGLGRELGRAAVEEYTEVKTVLVRQRGRPEA